MDTLDLQRRFFAEELEAVCRLRSPALVEAFAAVRREHFLPPGPWTVLSDGPEMMIPGSGAGIRTETTPDADPRRVYHDIVVAIDPARQLFNGQPGTLGAWIDLLDLKPGQRVLHVGSGLGYYTAVMAHCVGASGRVLAFEVDEPLASDAARRLAAYPCVELRHGDASVVDGEFDAILVNAGVTHPLDAWLDALAPGGRMLLPITAAMPAMGSTLGKGVVALSTKQPDEQLSARIVTLVAVYSAVGIRDEAMNPLVGKALMAGPAAWTSVKRLRRDIHTSEPACWLHGPTCCWSA